jgi:CheY-like chemotaxis protein
MKNYPRVILLDDDQFALTIATKVVRDYIRRIEVLPFSACEEAIECLEADYSKGEFPETVLLTDLHMPGMDGFCLLDRIENASEAMKERLHVFVLSAAACPDEIRKVLAYRCVTGFYDKPLSMSKMARIMACVLYQL